MKFYTGVGSRKITEEIRRKLGAYAVELYSRHYVCRTGSAPGSDEAFRDHAKQKIVYHPKQVLNDPDHWSYQMVKNYIPTDRDGFDHWKPFIKALLARNMMQVLGNHGDSPSEFLVCWAPSTMYSDSSAGGTGYAIRCALDHDIPVYNVFDPKQEKEFDKFLAELRKARKMAE